MPVTIHLGPTEERDPTLMTLVDFRNLPQLCMSFGETMYADGLVIVPTGQKYGEEMPYMCMAYAPVVNGKVLGIVGGGSDVMHLDGIGGSKSWHGKVHSPVVHSIELGKKYDIPSGLVPNSAWTMDCLYLSGLMYLWPFHGRVMALGMPMSSFEVWTIDASHPDYSKYVGDE